MEQVKRYLLWIVLAVVLVILICIQLIWVGGIHSETAEANKGVKSSATKIKMWAGKARGEEGIPSRGDLAAAKKHLADIQANGASVREAWRKATRGLNAYMSNQTQKGGLIRDPRKEEETWISAPLFPESIRELYADLFADLRKALKETMAEKVMQMEVERLLAARRKESYTQAIAEAAARDNTDLLLDPMTSILDEEKLTPIKLSDVFDPTRPEDMWKAWRTYLITKDLLLRAVAKSEAQVDRTLMEPAPGALEKEEDPMAAMGDGDKNKSDDIERIPVKHDGYRWVEAITGLVVDGPEPGNKTLKGKKPKVEAEDAAAEADEEVDEEEDEFLDDTPVETEPSEPRYHDIFKVTIKMSAHVRVLQAFMKNMLNSEEEGFFYVPISVEFAPFGDGAVAGNYEKALKKQLKTLRDARRLQAATGAGAVTAAAPELITIAGFGYEPPVEATFVYEVYRFRYTDTDNPAPAKSTDVDG